MINLVKKIIKSIAERNGYYLINKSAYLGINPLFDIQKIVLDFSEKFPRQSMDIIFDIGANVGQSSINFSKSFPSSTIYAFEPIQATFENLRFNVREYSNINPYQVGFGKRKENREFYIYPASVLSSCVSESPMMSSQRSLATQTLKLQTVDEFCQNQKIDYIDLLKIDTEGFDFDVIQGAKNILETKKVGFIYFEFFYIGNDNSENYGGRLIDIHNYLINFHYRPVSFYTDFIHSQHSAGAYNALYMRWK